MRIIDLSHSIHPGMPVYPGTDPPIIQAATTLIKDGFIEKKITMFSHTGTHLDVPSHILENGKSLDEYAVSYFIGEGCKIDLQKLASRAIQVEDLVPWERKIGESKFVVLNTGWSRSWGKPSYYEGYPMLTTEAAEWLASGFGLHGIGIDSISVDPVGSIHLPIHRIVLGKGIVIIENLTSVESLGDSPFLFCCLPLKFQRADGSPVRATAILDVRQ